MKFYHNIHIAIIALIFSVTIFSFTLFRFELSRVSDDSTKKEIVIEPGSIDSIATTLYENGLIRSKFAFKLYSKLSGKTNLKAATYLLSANMGTKEIIEELYLGKGSNTKQISITFKEGLNIRKITEIITENTNILENDITTALTDKQYLQQLISEYWFLSDDILDDNIYYALEGYLYPNTYFFNSKDVTIQEVFKVLLDETKKQLSPYQEQISKSHLSIHQIMTLASIVELEGVTLEDRKGIAGVFFNRLDKGMPLGSDVTTYYGAKIDMGERDLYSKEVQECNQYNTRCSTFTKLPISPICSPSIEAIEAVLNPTGSDNYYFVADKNKKIYFSKNITEHNNTISRLKKDGLWYEY